VLRTVDMIMTFLSCSNQIKKGTSRAGPPTYLALEKFDARDLRLCRDRAQELTDLHGLGVCRPASANARHEQNQ
jgi:hypothetical protein